MSGTDRNARNVGKMYTDNRGGAHEPKLVIGQLETRDMHIDVGKFADLDAIRAALVWIFGSFRAKILGEP